MSALDLTATRTGGGFAGADEGAEELFVHQGSNRVHVQALSGKECARIGNAIDPGGFDVDRFKTCGRQLGAIFAFLESSSETSDPE